jgi:hypothetical protein
MKSNLCPSTKTSVTWSPPPPTKGSLWYPEQFDIHRKLADVALAAQVVGSGEACGTDNRQHRFAADFLVLSVMATTTRQLTVIRCWGLELQQFG